MRNNNSSSFRFLIHSRSFSQSPTVLGSSDLYFFLLHVAVSSGLNASQHVHAAAQVLQSFFSFFYRQPLQLKEAQEEKIEAKIIFFL